jgi:site-specific DNA-cytosine methylase
MMKILDLFAGKGGELRRKNIEALGHEYTTLDIDPRFGCDITADIMGVNDLGLYDFIWASVPCETWSVASIGHHWTGGKGAYIPKSDNARYMIELVQHTLRLMNESAKIAWVVENPRGVLRKMPFMQDIRRQTVTYCQYGETRMKPTDIWTCGLNWKARPVCKNGDPCHQSAPRGARTGTQGIKNYADKSVVPLELWIEILDAVGV